MSFSSCLSIFLSIFHVGVGTNVFWIRKVISYNSQGRDHAIDLIISAIRSAIQYCASHDTLTSTTTKAEESSTPEEKQKKADVHESDPADDTAGFESHLKEAVIAVFGSARAAFHAYSKDGAVGKKEFKKLVKKCLPSLKPAETKQLRRSLPNRLSSVDFCSYIGRPQDAGSSTCKGKTKRTKEADSSGLASLPPEVPEVSRRTHSLVIHIHVHVLTDACSLYVCSSRRALGLACTHRNSC